MLSLILCYVSVPLACSVAILTHVSLLLTQFLLHVSVREWCISGKIEWSHPATLMTDQRTKQVGIQLHNGKFTLMSLSTLYFSLDVESIPFFFPKNLERNQGDQKLSVTCNERAYKRNTYVCLLLKNHWRNHPNSNKVDIDNAVELRFVSKQWYLLFLNMHCVALNIW